MANNFNLSILITANINDFSRKMNEVVAKTEVAGRKLQDVGSALSIGVTAPILAIGTAAVSSAVKFEQLAVSLNVLTGSAEKGAEMMERLTEYSARTPFQLQDLARTNNMLLGFGLSAEDAFTALQQLGDVSALTGANINNIAVAYGQAAGEGRLMTRDLLQFVNNGVPIYRLLEEVTGQNAAALREMASEGRISFDILKEAMSQATTEGGLFFEGTEQLAGTLGGQLSTLRDNFQLLLADFGDALGNYLKPLTDEITRMIQGFRGLDDSTKALILKVSALAAAVGPLMATMGFLATNVVPGLLNAFSALASPLGLITVALGGLAYLWAKNKIEALAMRGAFAEAASKTIALEDATNDLKESLEKLNEAKKEGAKQSVIEDLERETRLRLMQARAAYEQIQASVDLARQKHLEKIANLEAMGASADALEQSKKMTPWLDLAKERSREAAEQISHLEKEMGMLGKAMEDGTEDVTNQVNAVKNLEEAYKDIGEIISMTGFRVTEADSSEGLGFGISDIVEGDLDQIERLGNGFMETQNRLQRGIEQLSGRIGGMLTNSFVALLDGSENALESIGEMFRGLIVQIAAAAAAAALLSAILSTIFPGAGSATSFGAIFSGLSGLPQFAEGGIVSGPTLGLIGEYSGARTNPEVIAPLDKLQSIIGANGGGNVNVIGKISGEDILLSTERAINRRSRQTGYGFNG